MDCRMKIKPIDKKEAFAILEKYHYTPNMPRLTKHFLGCFESGQLVGVVTLGWGTRPKCTIRKMFDGLDTKDYFEIGKMAMLDSMPRNSESRMLSAVVQWMKKNTECQYLYSLADGIVGKVGYVYQAANFYSGDHFWTDIYMSKDGEKIHPRSCKELLDENATFLGKKKVFWMTPEFMQLKGIRKIKGKMFRYIYPLNKKARRGLKRSNMNWSLKHPKEDALQWKDATKGGRAIILDRIPEFNLQLSTTKARIKNTEAFR